MIPALKELTVYHGKTEIINCNKMWQILQDNHVSWAIKDYWKKRLILLQEKMSNIYAETWILCPMKCKKKTYIEK